MRFEAAIITSANKGGVSGIVALPGAQEIMKNVRIPPFSSTALHC